MGRTTLNLKLDESEGLSRAIAACEKDRAFQGDSEGRTADITGYLPHEFPPDEPAEEEEAVEEPAEPEKVFKYKDQEAAEAAALETERAVARLSYELEGVKDLAYQTLFPQGEGQGRSPTETPPGEDPVEFTKQRRRKVLDQIESLDWDNDDYNEKVAAIQAQADLDILERHSQAHEAEMESRAAYEREVDSVIDEAQKALGDAGLDNSPNSLDTRLFWELSRTVAVERNGVPIPLQDQISEVVEQLKAYKNQDLETYKASGGVGEITQPTTLSSVIDAVSESRRM